MESIKLLTGVLNTGTGRQKLRNGYREPEIEKRVPGTGNLGTGNWIPRTETGDTGN